MLALIRCGGEPLASLAHAAAAGDAPGGISRPARGGCSVTRRAAVRWASSCLPLLPLFRTLRDRKSFLGARSLGRGRTRCDRPRRALTNPPFQPRTGRRGDLGAPMGPRGPRAVARPPVAGRKGAAGPLAGEGPCLRRKVGEQAPQLFYRNIPACAPGVPAPPVAASRVFPRTVGLSALRAALGSGCAHAPVRGSLALALGLLRAPSRGSGRPASHGGQAHSLNHERARSTLRPPVRPPVPPFRVGGAVGVGSWCRRLLQARGAQGAGFARPFVARAPRAFGRRGVRDYTTSTEFVKPRGLDKFLLTRVRG